MACPVHEPVNRLTSHRTPCHPFGAVPPPNKPPERRPCSRRCPGRSPPGPDVSLAAQGSVFTELLAHWDLEEPLVAAHDFGGAVSLRVHLLHGARYRSLALVDPVALAPWSPPFFRLVGEHSEEFEQLPPALHTLWCRSTGARPAAPACTRSPRPAHPLPGRRARAAFQGRRTRSRGRPPAVKCLPACSLARRRHFCSGVRADRDHGLMGHRQERRCRRPDRG